MLQLLSLLAINYFPPDVQQFVYSHFGEYHLLRRICNLLERLIRAWLVSSFFGVGHQILSNWPETLLSFWRQGVLSLFEVAGLRNLRRFVLQDLLGCRFLLVTLVVGEWRALDLMPYNINFPLLPLAHQLLPLDIVLGAGQPVAEQRPVLGVWPPRRVYRLREFLGSANLELGLVSFVLWRPPGQHLLVLEDSVYFLVAGLVGVDDEARSAIKVVHQVFTFLPLLERRRVVILEGLVEDGHFLDAGRHKRDGVLVLVVAGQFLAFSSDLAEEHLLQTLGIVFERSLQLDEVPVPAPAVVLLLVEPGFPHL